MGGRSGRGISLTSLRELEESAKTKFSEKSETASQHVFISFAHENINEVNLLRGQAKNNTTDLQFDDYSVKEAFNSTNADYIKSQIREKINKASITVVYLSKQSANSDWVNWEINESIKQGKGVIGVYSEEKAPKALPESFIKNSCKSVKWSHAALSTAIKKANNER